MPRALLLSLSISILISTSINLEAKVCGKIFSHIKKSWIHSSDFILSNIANVMGSPELRSFKRKDFFLKKNQYFQQINQSYFFVPIEKPYEILSYIAAFKQFKEQGLPHLKDQGQLSDVLGLKNNQHKTETLLAIAKDWMRNRKADEDSIKEFSLITYLNNKLDPQSIFAFKNLKPENQIKKILKLIYESEAHALVIKNALAELGINFIPSTKPRRSSVQSVASHFKNPSLNLLLNIPMILFGELPIFFYDSNTYLKFTPSLELIHSTYQHGYNLSAKEIENFHKPQKWRSKLSGTKSNIFKYWNIFAISTLFLGNPFYSDPSQKFLHAGESIVKSQESKSSQWKQENDEAIPVMRQMFLAEIEQLKRRIPNEPQNRALLEESIAEIELMIVNVENF